MRVSPWKNSGFCGPDCGNSTSQPATRQRGRQALSPAGESKMDAASAASNAQDAMISAVPAVAVPVATAKQQGASQQPTTTSAANNGFIGPSPEPGVGGPDASPPAADGDGGGNDGEINGSSGHEEKEHGKVRQGAEQERYDKDNDDDDLADLADMDVRIPLHDMDDSESDEDNDDSNADLSMAKNEITARAPSIANGWDDSAVTSCFDRAIRMHSLTAVQLARETEGDGWEAGPNALPPTMARNTCTENGVASCNSADENKETTTTEQPICAVANVEVVTTSISDPFGENEGTGALQKEEEAADPKKSWKPRPLPLPPWAVDPVYAAANLRSKGLGAGIKQPN